DGFFQGGLRTGHRRALRLGIGYVVGSRERLDVGNFAGCEVNQRFEEFPLLRGIDQELELAISDLKFARDRLAHFLTGRETLLQAHLGVGKRPPYRLLTASFVVVIIIVIPGETIVASEAYQGCQTHSTDSCCCDHLSACHFYLHHSVLCAMSPSLKCLLPTYLIRSH